MEAISPDASRRRSSSRGALCRQALEQRGITIGSHITKLYKTWTGAALHSGDADEGGTLCRLGQQTVPVLAEEHADTIALRIEAARMELNSLGGIVETAILGLPTGLGDPFFDSMESRLAHILFSVPAVKGVSFGIGADFADMTGAEANDPYTVEDGQIRTVTNQNGGILGGITNGMPLTFETVIKPTPSISRPQQSVNLETRQIETLTIVGRHDPCIVPRAIPVLEAAAAIAIYDAWKGAKI